MGLGRLELPTKSLGNSCSIHLSYSPTLCLYRIRAAFAHGTRAHGRIPGVSPEKIPGELLGVPTTLYKQDPEQTPTAEWHEVGCARNPSGEWFLWERHGWWDNDNKRVHFDVPILSEPFKTESDMGVAFTARIQTLERGGWVYKFTTTFDMRAGRLIPQRIP